VNSNTDAAAEPNTTAPVVFELDGISKRYGATQALRDVSLAVRSGEFVALLGPNGAGKSTLIKVLDGVVTADSGTVRVSAEAGGLGIVHQDLGLVENMTVVENLFLGRSRSTLRLGNEAREAKSVLREVGLTGLDPHVLIEDLTLGERTMVAVAKLLGRGDRVVVIDEVTAGLPPVEAEWLVRRLRDAAHLGTTVMMVTHRLREVEGIADRYVVMVDGEVAVDVPSSSVTIDDVIEVMSAGRSVSSHATPAHPSADPNGSAADVVCRLVGARCGGAGPIDLELRAGQIVGITGLIGSGLHDVAYMVAGRVRNTGGSIEMDKRIRRGCVPAHRESEAVFPEDTEEFNLTAGEWRRWRGPTGLLRVRAIRAEAERVAAELDIRPHDLEMQVGRLSGGNQQKTVLGRALINDPDLIVLCEPTRGVDVATRREIYAQIRSAAQRGTAVFIASSDVEDLAALAQTVGVMTADGRIDRWIDNVEGTDLSLLATEFI
jgi:ABC-type sugar transport system ATPase subunit